MGKIKQGKTSRKGLNQHGINLMVSKVSLRKATDQNKLPQMTLDNFLQSRRSN